MMVAKNSITSKSSLAVFLSKLNLFANPDIKLEQYPTDSEIAAEILWNAFMRSEIQNKTVADLGCGTGILGIGSLILGARFVYFVDLDSSALEILKKNLLMTSSMLDIDLKEGIDYKIFNKDINQFSEQVDLVIQNPPFGTRNEHSDRDFLLRAFALSNLIYTFHKESTSKFVEAISKDAGFVINEVWHFGFPIKSTYAHHKKKIERIAVNCWRLEKIS